MMDGQREEDRMSKPYSQILYEVAGHIATITLNRPEKRNAFSGTMGEEIYDAFSRAIDDKDARAIILTGSGDTFCVGIDLAVIEDDAERDMILKHFATRNYHCPKPTLCAMNGTSVGVGITMAVSFDIRIGTEDAKFAVPFAKLGLLPGFGASHLLPGLVGRSRALELVLGAGTIRGPEALAMGLIDRMVPAGEALNTARAMATAMAGYDPVVLAMAKQSIDFGVAHSLEESLENEGKLAEVLNARRAASKGKTS
jgi:2-(1,2-epoxy-1,2-dihydrophenyl)acetyl-CoA isomerase